MSQTEKSLNPHSPGCQGSEDGGAPPEISTPAIPTWTRKSQGSPGVTRILFGWQSFLARCQHLNIRGSLCPSGFPLQSNWQNKWLLSQSPPSLWVKPGVCASAPGRSVHVPSSSPLEGL
jgi:hypothetical protein